MKVRDRTSRRLALAAGLLVLCAAAPVSGDIDALVKNLRSEPMTLFDWGLFLLEEELQSVRRNQSDYLRVLYDVEQKRIVIDAVFLITADEVKAVTADRACYTRHHAIKLTLGVIDTDRIHLAPAADFRLGTKFSHHNSDAYPDLPDAAAVGAELMKTVFIKVAVATDIDNFPFDLLSRCTGLALSQDVEFNGVANKDLLTR